MKIRQGFVSNSSSTSFTFMIKGDKMEDVYDLIKKYNQYFDLYYSSWDDEKMHCTADNVVKAIKEVKNVKLIRIEKFKKDLEEHRERISKELEKEKSKDYLNDWYFKDLMDMMEKEITIDDTVKSGFKNVLIIGFGDNDGEISGDPIGTTMDYEGRCISINKPDFIVFTEQNR